MRIVMLAIVLLAGCAGSGYPAKNMKEEPKAAQSERLTIVESVRLGADFSSVNLLIVKDSGTGQEFVVARSLGADTSVAITPIVKKQ